MLLIEKMKHKEDFTILERQISEYILEHRDEIFELSLAEFSKRLYVSKATMIRYFKKLGFASYRELCVELAKELSLYESGVAEENGSYFKEDETVADIAKKIQMINTNALAISYEYLNFRDIEEMADIILQFNRIYLYAYGEGGTAAMRALQTRLISLGKDTTLIDYNDLHMQRYKSFDKKALVIFAVYNDSEGQAAGMAKDIHTISLPIILICGPYANEVERYAYRSVRTMYAEDTEISGPLGSVRAMEYLTDILFYAVRKKAEKQMIL